MSGEGGAMAIGSRSRRTHGIWQRRLGSGRDHDAAEKERKKERYVGVREKQRCCVSYEQQLHC